MTELQQHSIKTDATQTGKRSVLYMMWYYLREYPSRISLSATCFLLVGFTDILGVAALLPLLNLLAYGKGGGDSNASRWMVDAFAWIGVQPTVGNILLFIVATTILKALLVILAMTQVGFAGAYVGADVRRKMLKAQTNAKWEFFVQLPAGRLAAALGAEVQKVSGNYNSIAKIMADSIRAAVHLAFAAALSWQVTLAALFVGTGTVLILSRLMTMTRQAGARHTNTLASFTARLVDGLGGMKALKAMARETRLAALLDWEIGGLQSAERSLSILSQSVRALQEPIGIAALAAGIYFVWEDWIGGIDVMLVLALLFLRSVQSINSIQHSFQNIMQREAAYWFVFDLIEQAQRTRETGDGIEAPTLSSSLKLDEVDYAYSDEAVIKGAAFEIPAKSFAAITGPSGVGKTTLADLISGLLRPTKGEVLIDGVPLARLNLMAWRGMIGYVPQDVFLFHDTILTNVTLGDADLTPGDAERALRSAGAWEFIEALPEGADTIVGERGSRLSGGQRQRIAIARALVRQPSLLILDEATTALDPSTERAICETLKGLSGTVTILAISHQTALVETADIVFRVKDGEVIREETPLIDAVKAGG